jgi:hypothetical protein
MASQPGGRSLGLRRKIYRLNHRPAPISSLGGQQEDHNAQGAAAEAFGGVHWAVLMTSSNVGRKPLKKQEDEKRFKAGKGDREC